MDSCGSTGYERVGKMKTVHNAVADVLESRHLDLEEVTAHYSESMSWVTTLHSKNGQSALNNVKFHITLRNGEYSVGIICPYPQEHRHTLVLLCIEIQNAITGY